MQLFAHIAFDRSNAMLALSGIVKFYTKDVTHHLRGGFYGIYPFYAVSKALSPTRRYPAAP